MQLSEGNEMANSNKTSKSLTQQVIDELINELQKSEGFDPLVIESIKQIANVNQLADSAKLAETLRRKNNKGHEDN